MFFVSIPLFAAFLIKSRRRLGVALSVLLILEDGFFLLVPVIPVTQQSNSSGTVAWTRYGSPSQVYYCFGATMELQTSPPSAHGNVLQCSPPSGCISVIAQTQLNNSSPLGFAL